MYGTLHALLLPWQQEFLSVRENDAQPFLSIPLTFSPIAFSTSLSLFPSLDCLPPHCLLSSSPFSLPSLNWLSPSSYLFSPYPSHSLFHSLNWLCLAPFTFSISLSSSLLFPSLNCSPACFLYLPLLLSLFPSLNRLSPSPICFSPALSLSLLDSCLGVLTYLYYPLVKQ